MDSEPPATSADIHQSNPNRFKRLEKWFIRGMFFLGICEILLSLVTGQILIRHIEQPQVAFMAHVTLFLLTTWMITVQVLLVLLFLLLGQVKKK